MHAEPLLLDLVVLLTASLPIVLICHRLALPAVVGFLVTGIVIGPSAFALVDSPERVSTLAEDISFTESGATVVEQRELWDMPIFLLLILASVGAEWAYRRRRGLA